MPAAYRSSAVPTALMAALLTIATACPQILQYADREPDGMAYPESGGLLTLFDAGEDGRWLNQVEVYVQNEAAREAEEFALYVVDLDGRLLREVRLPNAILGSGEADWRNLPIAPMQVPQEFGVGIVCATQATPQVTMATRFLGEAVEKTVHFALTDLVEWGSGVRVGTYSLPESHSYHWLPGTAGTGLGSQEWMVRAYMAGEFEGDPQATDVVVLRSNEAFVDHVISAEGDPLDVVTKAHGKLPRKDVAVLRLGAVRVPEMGTAVVDLEDGGRIEGTLLHMDAENLQVRTPGGTARTIARASVTTMAFRDFEPVPVASQPIPTEIVNSGEQKRGWGPEQVVGPPDTEGAGDIRTAWAAQQPDGGQEWLRVTYGNVVELAEVRIRETFNPGAVTKVTAVPEDQTEVTLWEGQDTTADVPGDFVVPVKGEVSAKVVKIYFDTKLKQGWNEIDAVELVARDGTRQWASTVAASSSYADR